MPPAMTNAIGIAGSLAGGLLEFANGDGGMVKRLHLGRASEAGVLAASLAAAGFAGPHTVLEGEFGFLRVFCTEFDESRADRGLGREFRDPEHGPEALSVPCHRACRGQGGARVTGRARFRRGEVEAITVTGSRRMVERHNIAEPADLMLAQYSIPFCVALALHREARDPESYDESALADPAIRAPDAARAAGAGCRCGARRDGQHGNGRPRRRPALRCREESGLLAAGELQDKFTRLTRRALGSNGARLYERLRHIEDEADLAWLGAPGEA